MVAVNGRGPLVVIPDPIDWTTKVRTIERRQVVSYQPLELRGTRLPLLDLPNNQLSEPKGSHFVILARLPSSEGAAINVIWPQLVIFRKLLR